MTTALLALGGVVAATSLLCLAAVLCAPSLDVGLDCQPGEADPMEERR